MTLEEKRDKLTDYCVCTACATCVLNSKQWEHICDDTRCLYIDGATEGELDHALELIAGKL